MKKQLLTTLITLTYVQSLFAQGALGIDAASSEIATYIDPVANFILIVGAVVGLIGGVSGLSIDRSRISVSMNEYMDNLIPASKIAALKAGELVAQIGREPDNKSRSNL